MVSKNVEGISTQGELDDSQEPAIAATISIRSTLQALRDSARVDPKLFHP